MEKPTPPPMEQPCPSAVEAVIPSNVEEKESSLRRISQEDQEKKIKSPAGSASASSGAEASPASEAVNEDDWLLRGKVRLSSFYSRKFTLGATKEPSQKFIAWLGGDCGCTQEEIKSLLATEYPLLQDSPLPMKRLSGIIAS